MIVNPTFVLGPDDPTGTSNRLVRRLLSAACPPTSMAGSTSSTYATSPAGTCSPTSAASEGERYLLAARNFTLQRLFADLGRIAGVPPPPLKLHGPMMLAGTEARDRSAATFTS